MTTNIYVGNLPYSTNSDELRNIFAEHGEVADANVITDRDTGRSRGFGFVEMASTEDAQKAIDALNGAEMGGRRLNVNIAKERRR